MQNRARSNKKQTKYKQGAKKARDKSNEKSNGKKASMFRGFLHEFWSELDYLFTSNWLGSTVIQIAIGCLFVGAIVILLRPIWWIYVAVSILLNIFLFAGFRSFDKAHSPANQASNPAEATTAPVFSGQPHTQENKMTGTLVPKVILSAKSDVFPRIEIGGSGVFFGDDLQTGYRISDLKPILSDCDFSAEFVDGHIKFSMSIRDANGNVVAQVIKNEWSVSGRPISWDRNYNQNSLEVRDNGGKIILQVTVLEDRVQLQAIWFRTNGHRACAIQSAGTQRPRIGYAMFIPDGFPEQFSINNPNTSILPMFKYPSELHLGELIEERK